MYEWRKLTTEQRAELLTARQRGGLSWHGPPHFTAFGSEWYHLTAACFEHQPRIGQSLARLSRFVSDLLTTVQAADAVAAWCVLPNHYHLLLRTAHLRTIALALGRLHGRAARRWNLEERVVGRTVFHRAADRRIRSERHYWATVNYIHHNPVRHGYVDRWTDWRWSSASDFLSAVGRSEAIRIWRSYPIRDYGEKWDAPEM